MLRVSCDLALFVIITDGCEESTTPLNGHLNIDIEDKIQLTNVEIPSPARISVFLSVAFISEKLHDYAHLRMGG